METRMVLPRRILAFLLPCCSTRSYIHVRTLEAPTMCYSVVRSPLIAHYHMIAGNWGDMFESTWVLLKDVQRWL